MNYYQTPGYYMNSLYNNQYQYPYQQSMVQQPQQQFVQPQPQPQTILNGKVVDSEEMVKATEVPMGGYGVFPKADLSEIYLKTWNNNGTTSIVKYEPAVAAQAEETENSSTILSQLMEKITGLDEKIDSLIDAPKQQPPRKEVSKNGF